MKGKLKRGHTQHILEKGKNGKCRPVCQNASSLINNETLILLEDGEAVLSIYFFFYYVYI